VEGIRAFDPRYQRFIQRSVSRWLYARGVAGGCRPGGRKTKPFLKAAASVILYV